MFLYFECILFFLFFVVGGAVSGLALAWSHAASLSPIVRKKVCFLMDRVRNGKVAVFAPIVVHMRLPRWGSPEDRRQTPLVPRMAASVERGERSAPQAEHMVVGSSPAPIFATKKSKRAQMTWHVFFFFVY
ncbi:hypothetical protein psal_cds_125 [Pandoravirus salinus]|uniref:Uncharacterized protein n=1 Tax=Pandoravirus salinus TaxID=1349410 RepID=S4VVY1_9VIRU|nr:hypothetical protein psal_cds_125 [Pandoravirus salinus]AGO83576.1 hypothetical protein psal_cds_125 [Pandoravirus salinus]